MQRPPASRTSHGVLFSPYRYGDRKWEDYLLDTQTFIYDAGREQVEAVERVGRQAMEQGDRQMALLQDFIADAEGAWERVSSQLDILTDELVTGFSALSYQLRYHGELLQQIVDRMGHIAKNIANPLATQANELLRSGQHLMQRGLYGEAYSDFIAAESKRSVDPMLHLCLTQLHYKVRDEGVPFDLAAAERHANLAIRYATSLREDLAEDGAAVIDLVFRTAAHLALVKGGDLSIATGREAGTVELRRADVYLRQIDQPSPSSQFLHAQVLALLGQRDESIAKVRVLADSTRSWIPRALLEPHLATIADRVRALSGDLRATPGVQSQSVYRVIAIGRDFVGLSRSVRVTSNNAEKLVLSVGDLDTRIGEIERDFEAGAVNAISASSTLQVALDSVRKTTLELITASIKELEAELDQAKKTVDIHEGRAKSMLAGERNSFDGEGIGMLMILGCLFGWLAGLASCKAGFLNTCGEFFLAGPVGSIVLILLALLWQVYTNHQKHLDNITAIPVEKASAGYARKQAIEVTRRIDDLKRMRKAVAAS